MKFILILISVLFQIPTPIPTSTPAPTLTPMPTISFNQNEVINSLSTVEAQIDAQSTQMAVTGNQVIAGGRPVLPSDNTGNLLNYFKWLTSGSAQSVFGSFTPIVLHIAILVGLAIVGLLVYFGQMIVAAIMRAVRWIIDTVMKFIPFMG